MKNPFYTLNISRITKPQKFSVKYILIRHVEKKNLKILCNHSSRHCALAVEGGSTHGPPFLSVRGTQHVFRDMHIAHIQEKLKNQLTTEKPPIHKPSGQQYQRVEKKMLEKYYQNYCKQRISIEIK